MRRVILLALLALALPTAALANSIDFNLNGGSMTVTSNSVSIGSNVTAVGLCNPNCTNPGTPTSGTILITLPSFSTSSSNSFGSGGGVYLKTTSGYVFNGQFTSGTWSVFYNSKGKAVGYSFNGVATGTLTLNGNTIQTTLTFTSGNTIARLNPCPASKGVQTCSFSGGNANVGVVPEPGTLGLLGTGLIGLAGIVRRKFRS